ncbi:hypothetical protein PV05_09235 [Exophiala xenobiotica]|uniref:peptidylprolyl isomerase n=1 Tax=Exophiala xenobiotica TaxID=348802 RepID=A0A0D2F131_9EURO|nr:uncharacterized protein PV05_09235 [Exophiala xenobiotica]KIW53689.1 hypothetical protein PV05_09235 [Exophiala xenobiotica]
MATELQKNLIQPGNNTDYPRPGDKVTIEYTGWLHDPSKADNGYKGKQFDSSVGRGDFQTAIGVGQVIAGWDQGVTQMSLGEKSTLIIPGRMAYGDGGYPGLIPPNATLIFDVHLKGINGKKI